MRATSIQQTFRKEAQKFVDGDAPPSQVTVLHLLYIFFRFYNLCFKILQTILIHNILFTRFSFAHWWSVNGIDGHLLYLAFSKLHPLLGYIPAFTLCIFRFYNLCFQILQTTYSQHSLRIIVPWTHRYSFAHWWSTNDIDGYLLYAGAD